MFRLDFLKYLLYHTIGTFDNFLYGRSRLIYNEDLQRFAVDPTDLKFLFARNGFLLILVRKLLSQNPSYFYLRKKILLCSLSVKEWEMKLHSSSIVRNIILRDWTYVLDLSNLLRQLVSTFCDVIKGMYESESIDTEKLDRVVSSILERFLIMFQEQGIPLIDVFAVFNTFREGFYFFHDGRYFCIKIGSKHGIKVGRRRVVITLDSSTFFQKLCFIMRQLESNPVQHDLLFLMYRTILRHPNHRVAPSISFPFAVTISTNYRFWLSFLDWETTRSKFLDRCLYQFVSRTLFSKKDTKYYLQHTDISSFSIFFRNSHIHANYMGLISDLSFESI